jgi:biotin synthase
MPPLTDDCRRESPEYLRMSLAAAMTLGFKPGLFYRDARLYCVNLLLTYSSGCAARCSYCGLSRERPGAADGDKSFIRVSWPTYGLDEIIAAIAARPDRVKRVCISQVTNTRSIRDSIAITRRLRESFDCSSPPPSPTAATSRPSRPRARTRSVWPWTWPPRSSSTATAAAA